MMFILKTFAEVLLPIPLSRGLTYEVPEPLLQEIKVGVRVVVPLGARKRYTGIVLRIHNQPPESFSVKPIMEVLDLEPVVLPSQLKFWSWIASYYMCSEGEVMKAALPSGLKLESETLLRLNASYEADGLLSEREETVLRALSPDKDMRLLDLEKNTGISRILPLVQRLLDKGAVVLSEGLRETYKVKTTTYIRLSETVDKEPQLLHAIVDSLAKAQKQQALFLSFLTLSGCMDGKGVAVERKKLLSASNASASILQTLLSKGVLERYEKTVDRISLGVEADCRLSELSPKQLEALQSLRDKLDQKPVCLLHGQTSSGKTEVYIHLIQECIRSGKQVLYLVPEIALTTQLSNRLRLAFGAELGVFHSKFPDAERVEIWKKMLGENPYSVILGVRSSVFLPFKNLGLVVVDEEHENSYKQQDPAPRYHARNAVLVLAGMHQAKTVLGTATPSLETYHLCKTGKYGLVELVGRHYDIPLPEIQLVNTGELRRKKRMKGLFSPILKEEIESTLRSDGQVILFQNRRGYAPLLMCKDCGWIPKCDRCDVALTYHKNGEMLSCHYCGYERKLPYSCPSCASKALTLQGVGTEQLEEEVTRLFPEARVGRMDADTTRTRKSQEQLVYDFESGKTNVLIGTQMVSKGLDFKNVRLVGVLNADLILNFPDFRAHERSFQLLSQVSGRAGRFGGQGKVIIQATNTDQHILKDIQDGDFLRFYALETELRRQFSYPPYVRLVIIRLKHRDAEVVKRAAVHLSKLLQPYFGFRMLGPDKPLVSKINLVHIQQLLLKVDSEFVPQKVKSLLLQAQEELVAISAFKSVQVHYDVDPY